MKRIARRRSLKKQVVSTVAAAGAVVAIQIAPGCIIYAVMPPIDAGIVDSGSRPDNIGSDANSDVPVYYIMAQDAGPQQDAAQPSDAAPPSDAAQPDVPIYYVMAWDGGHGQDQPVYYIMAWDY